MRLPDPAFEPAAQPLEPGRLTDLGGVAVAIAAAPVRRIARMDAAGRWLLPWP